jgi:hypothetical protein
MPIQRVFFLVPPGVHLLDLTGPVQVFYSLLGFRPDLTLHYLKISEAVEVQSSAGL